MSKIYLIVNQDLEMSAGKLGSQTGHGVEYIMKYYMEHEEDRQEYYDYENAGSTKIILKAKENKLRALHDKFPNDSFLVFDAGKTEIPTGSLTVLAFKPLTKQPKELKRLSLYIDH